MTNQHTITQELLPWYVNGTLNANEMVLVQAHLARCPQCNAEVDRELTLARASQPSIADSKRLQILEAQRSTNFAALRSSLNRSQPQQAKLRYAQLCLGLLVAIVGGAGLWSIQPDPPSEFEAMTTPIANSVVVQVAFAEHITSQDLDNILKAIGGSVLNPPVHTSITRIRLTEPSHAQESLALLQTNPNVIWANRER